MRQVAQAVLPKQTPQQGTGPTVFKNESSKNKNVLGNRDTQRSASDTGATRVVTIAQRTVVSRNTAPVYAQPLAKSSVVISTTLHIF